MVGVEHLSSDRAEVLVITNAPCRPVNLGSLLLFSVQQRRRLVDRSPYAGQKFVEFRSFGLTGFNRLAQQVHRKITEFLADPLKPRLYVFQSIVHTQP